MCTVQTTIKLDSRRLASNNTVEGACDPEAAIVAALYGCSDSSFCPIPFSGKAGGIFSAWPESQWHAHLA